MVMALFPTLRTLETDAAAQGTPIATGITTEVSVHPAQIEPGQSGEVRVKIRTGSELPEEDLFVRVQFGPHVRPISTPTDPWACDEATNRGTDTVIVCHVPVEDKITTALKTLVFEVGVDENVHGLRGVSAIAWFGNENPPVRNWDQTQTGAESDSTMVSIAMAHQRGGPTGGTTSARTNKAAPTHGSSSTRGVMLFTTNDASGSSARGGVGSLAAPSPLFCQLFGAAGAVDTQLSIGPITFSSMSDSSNSGGACGASSVITLKASNIAFGSVRFTDVSGTVSPTQISFTMDLADGVSMTMSGPFPDSGTQYTASLTFPVGDSSVTLDGDVDYTDNSRFAVTLSASATTSGWSPFPGVSVGSGGVTGTFTRSVTGTDVVDTFSVTITFGGSWSPLTGVAVDSVTATIGNNTGDLVVSMGATLSGTLDLAGLTVDMGASVTGTIDVDSGIVSVTGSIGSFTIADLLTLGPASATVVYDPTKKSGSGNSGSGSGSNAPVTASLSGTASFAGDMAQFFQGSVSTNIALLEGGFVVEAKMDSSPSRPGYALEGPQLLWASLSDPLTTIRYSPSNSDQPAVPLGHQKAVATAPFGVPPALATALDDLGVDLLDDVGTGTIAFSLPPADPSISIYYDAPPDTYLIGNKNSSVSALFDDIFVSVSTGETESFTIGGDVALTLSKDVLMLTSALEVSSGPLGASIDGYLELTDTTGWPNAFGMTGVTLYELILQAGMADGLPSFAIEASASFPSSLTTPLGIVDGSVVTLGIDVSATNPCFLFAIDAPPTDPTRNVIDLGSGSLTATSAQMVVAPDGCQIGTNQYTGFQLEFNGAIRGVEVGFNTSFTLDPTFSLVGSGYVGSFPMGSLTFEETTVELSISDTAFSMRITGGVTAGSSLRANGEMYLESGGGFSFSGNGTIKVGGDEFDVSVAVTNCADSSCSTLTGPSFWASGKIVLKGFTFDSSIKIDPTGGFEATLEIPKRSSKFNFKSGSLNGSGTVQYSFFADVSSDGTFEVRGDFSASLSSCKWTFISCKGARTSVSDDLKEGYASVTVTASYAGIKARISVTVR